MNWKLLIVSFLAIGLCGCVQTRKQAMQVRSGEEKKDLQNTLAVITKKIEDLESNVAVLTEKVEKPSPASPDASEKTDKEKPVKKARIKKSARSGTEQRKKPAKADIARETEEAATTAKDNSAGIPQEGMINDISGGKRLAMVRELPSAEIASVKADTNAPTQYKRAFDLYVRGAYTAAAAEFDSFIATYPETIYTDNALYWKGECYYSLSKYTKAIEEFKKVVERFSGENKAPDAQLKIGYSYFELQDLDSARIALQKVMDLYPFSDAAKKAMVKLNSF